MNRKIPQALFEGEGVIIEECMEVICHFLDFAKEAGVRKETVDYINSFIK